MRFYPYDNELAHTFTISGFSRDVTHAVLVEISYEGVTGYGEAALPPCMTGPTVATPSDFRRKVALSRFTEPS